MNTKIKWDLSKNPKKAKLFDNLGSQKYLSIMKIAKSHDGK